VLRRSVAVPGLLNALGVNLRQGRRDVRLFEIGHVFFPDRPLPIEEKRVAFLLHGALDEAEWSDAALGRKRRPADFFDGKGLVEAIGRRLGAPLALEREGAPAFLHPGQSAVIVAGTRRVGWLGVLHPETAERLELRDACVLAEIGMEALLAEAPASRRFEALPRFPAVTRDLSLIAEDTRSAESLEREIRAAAGPALQSVSVVDRYAGSPVPSGKVSLTLTLRYQHEARTLTGDEVQKSVDQVIAALQASGATIRGE